MSEYNRMSDAEVAAAHALFERLAEADTVDENASTEERHERLLELWRKAQLAIITPQGRGPADPMFDPNQKWGDMDLDGVPF